MKQQKRLIIVAFLWVAFILIVCTSCRTRKVVAEKDKFSDKSKTEEKVNLKTEETEQTKDKSKTTETVKDSTKTEETDETVITADEIIKEKDGTLHFKGSVTFKGKKQTNTSAGKESRSESLKDVVTDKTVKKDSTVKKSEQKDIESDKRKKDTDVHSISWWTIAIPALIVLLLALLAVKWNALAGFWWGLFR